MDGRDDNGVKSGDGLSMEEVRGRLRGLGYLKSPVERYLTMVRRGGMLGGLAIAVQYSMLIGVLLAGLTSVSNLMADHSQLAGTTDTMLLMVGLAGAYSLTLLVVILPLSLYWSGKRKSISGYHRFASPFLSIILGTVLSAVLCTYLTGWWHSVLRSSQNLLPFSFAAVGVMVSIGALSVMAGRLLGFIYLLLAGVPRQPRRQGNHLALTYGYALAVVVLIESAWAIGVFRHHNADHTLADALELYRPHQLPVLVVGFDGLDRPTVEALAAADSLPNLMRLIEDGFSAPLVSRGEYLAPQVWTTVSTGVKPEVHGLDGFTKPIPWGMSRSRRIVTGRPDLDAVLDHVLPFAAMIRRVPVSAASRMTRTLWEINELFANPAGVVNWWATWPADISSGFTISERTFSKIDYFHRQQGINPSNYYQREVYPAAEFDVLVDLFQPLTDSFENLLQNFPVIAELIEHSDTSEVASLVRSVFFADYFYTMAAVEVARERRVRFLAIYLQGADVLARLEERVDNVNPEDIAPLVREYYRFADVLLGRLVELYQPSGLLAVICEPGKIGRRAGIEGLGLFSGLDVRHGARGGQAMMLEDVAPTVLYLTGLPVSRNMSGTALSEAGDVGPGGARRLSYVTTFGPPPIRLETANRYSNDREMLQRLRSIGYVR